MDKDIDMEDNLNRMIKNLDRIVDEEFNPVVEAFFRESGISKKDIYDTLKAGLSASEIKYYQDENGEQVTKNIPDLKLRREYMRDALELLGHLKGSQINVSTTLTLEQQELLANIKRRRDEGKDKL